MEDKNFFIFKKTNSELRKKMRFKNLAIAFIIISPLTIFSELDIISNSINGTENLNLALSDKQLGILNYFAHLTILQAKNGTVNSTNFTAFGWEGWESNYNNDQRFLQAVRYPLAFIGYAVSFIVYKTPGYRELAINIVDNVIQRLLEEHQYEYIENYWKDLKSFPDPVYVENIMYSGHLAMLIALYESISGNFKYSESGWFFKWNGEKRFHYNTTLLMNAILRQVKKDETGGVACEPNSIFVICNNHHRIAYQIYDAIHKTNYSQTNDKWEDWLKHHGRAPDILPDGDYRYFRIIYYSPIHAWIPLYGTSGNDAWALTFMNSWIKDKKFAADGYEQMLKSHQWKQVSIEEAYLDAGYFGKLSELNTWLASSLFLSVENQYASVKTNKSFHVINWFEKNFGALGGDTCKNSYSYNINDTEYQIWTTANLFLSMITNNKTFNEMYNNPFYEKHLNEPELTGIRFPELQVSYAYYNQSLKSFNFGLKTMCNLDIFNESFQIEKANSYQKAYLIQNNTLKDITKLGKFDVSKKQISFETIQIKYDLLNNFQVFL